MMAAHNVVVKPFRTRLSCSINRPDGKIWRQVSPYAASRNSGLVHCVRPGQQAHREQHKGGRISLDYIGGRAPGMGGTRAALGRPIRWHPHLDRASGHLLSQGHQQRPYRVAQQLGRRLVSRRQSLGDHGNRVYRAGQGHVRTIRPGRRPGSGALGRTQHDGQGIVASGTLRACQSLSARPTRGVT